MRFADPPYAQVARPVRKPGEWVVISIRELMLLDVLVAVLVGLDLFRTLRSGRISRRGGSVTRQREPDKYWKYVYASCALLLLCGVGLVWMIVSPDSFVSAGAH